MPTLPAARGAAPKPSKSAAGTRRIMEKLAAQHPNADTELNFTTPFELLVATILSAQCTDERVNQVTPALFKRYPDARALARATTGELEPQIQSTGFFRAKSKSLVGMATAVVAQHGGEVPKTMDALVKLPGVGRKTANVVLGHALGVPGLPVDRHVLRVANRIGIARSEDPEVVEQQLCAAMPPPRWTITSDTLILHGRRICKPRPLCDRCAVRDDCDYYRSLMGVVKMPAVAGSRAAGNASNSAAALSAARAAQPSKGGRSPVAAARRAAEPRGPSRAATPRGPGRGAAPPPSERADEAPAKLGGAPRTRGAARRLKE